MDLVEIFTAICGLIQSVLIMFKRKENWIFYLLNIISLTVYSYSVSLWGDVLENSVYIIFGLLGFSTWYSKNISQKLFGENNNIRYCSQKELARYSIMFIAIAIGMTVWLTKTNDPSPILDAITTAMGFTATLMMAFKRIESWIIWFIDDILMAYIYFSLPDPAIYLCALNVIWIALAAGTWYSWHMEYSKKKRAKHG